MTASMVCICMDLYVAGYLGQYGVTRAARSGCMQAPNSGSTFRCCDSSVIAASSRRNCTHMYP